MLSSCRYTHLILGLFLFIHACLAFGHKASDSYLSIHIADLDNTGQLDVALRDLEYAVGLDANEDGAITWAELSGKREIVTQFVLSHLSFRADGFACILNPTNYLVDNHSDGAYLVLIFAIDCGKAIDQLIIDYGLFFDFDPLHRGLLRFESEQASQTAVFSPSQRSQHFIVGQTSDWGIFFQYWRLGISHIGSGYDHILFLMSLLLPAVLIWRECTWIPAPGFYPALLEVVKVVTAFTLAHSLTLSLATFGWLELPSRWVESGIAASIIIAALNNLYPLVDKRRWAVAFCFGLLHGLGFANVLRELGLPIHALWLALLAFNLGVESGQLSIVTMVLPVTYFLRMSIWYQRVILGAGSVFIGVLALVWLIERAWDIRLLSL